MDIETENKLNEAFKEIVFDMSTDKLNKNYNSIDYLKEETDEELLAAYLILYKLASQETSLDMKRDELIDSITQLFDSKFKDIFSFFPDDDIKILKELAKKEGINELSTKNKNMGFYFSLFRRLQTMRIIKLSNDNGKVKYHIPNDIRKKILKLPKSTLSKKYDDILRTTTGIANTYGNIDVSYAYDIIAKKYYNFTFEEYYNIVFISSLFEICRFFLNDDNRTITSIWLEDNSNKLVPKKHVLYDYKFYQSMEEFDYLFALEEYNDLKMYLTDNFDIEEYEIDNDEYFIDEFILSYVYYSQYDTRQAEKKLNDMYRDMFSANIIQLKEIKELMDLIKDKFPVWKKGGIIKK